MDIFTTEAWTLRGFASIFTIFSIRLATHPPHASVNVPITETISGEGSEHCQDQGGEGAGRGGQDEGQHERVDVVVVTGTGGGGRWTR